MIPKTAHFIWFGSNFPYVYGLALHTAAEYGGFEQVILHHTDNLDNSPGWKCVAAHPRCQKRHLVPEEIFSKVPKIGDRLLALYKKLSQPAAKSNMIRAALLYNEGGVYLDTDIITLKPFGQVMDTEAFCGEEYIALPSALKTSSNPFAYVGAGARLLVRDVFRRLPEGWRTFKKLQKHYPAIVNNAVLASQKGDQAIYHLISDMVNLNPARQLKRFALGTHLLENAVATRKNDFTVYPSEYFFPVAPEISEHLFKKGTPGSHLEMLDKDTICIHWYASVRTRPFVDKLTPAWIREHANDRPICAILAPLLPQGA